MMTHEESHTDPVQLGGISKTSSSKKHVDMAELDREWAEDMRLGFGLRPKLTEAQQAAVEMDYGMTAGRLVISIRAALAPLLIRWLRAALNPKAIRPDQSPGVVKAQPASDSRLNALRAESERRVVNLDVFEFSR